MFASNINNSLKSNQENNKNISIANENNNPFTPQQFPSLNEQGISAFAEDYVGNIYAGTNNGLYKSIDGINFNKIDTINNNIITGIIIAKTKNIYISTNCNGLYKSTDGINFKQVNESPKNIMFNSLIITSNNVVYMGTYKGNGGIWTINLLFNINKHDTFDKSWSLYQVIVYNSVQKIDIKENLVASAKLDNKNITIPTTNLDLTNGQHTLVLTLKDKSLATVFGVDSNTGQFAYKLWVKTSIDKKDINYSTNTYDTDLTDLSLGFVSNTGNTINCPIVQTKSKDRSMGMSRVEVWFLLNKPIHDILKYI